MRYLVWVVIVSSSVLGAVFNEQFPIGPDPRLTPGETCGKADEYRYAERIAYCDRSVGSERKMDIIRDYDRQLGFHVGEMDRKDFKIDHYIPLCMGGSNTDENLWPQHKSIYVQTDLLEDRMCQLMEMNRIKQAEAIDLIRQAKNHLDDAPGVLRDVEARLRQ